MTSGLGLVGKPPCSAAVLSSVSHEAERLHLGGFAVFMASIETCRLIEARRHLSSFRLNPLLHLGAMRG